MFIVYVLKSVNANWFYIGLTTNINKRLHQHNKGGTKSTKHNRPYEVVYIKQFADRGAARNFEKYLKIRSNKEKILRKLKVL